MPRIPIFKLGSSAEEIQPPNLAAYTPTLPLEGLQLGIDNLRYDVHLSPRFVEQLRLHVARLIARHGDVEALLSAEASEKNQGNQLIGSNSVAKARNQVDPTELKSLLTELQVV